MAAVFQFNIFQHNVFQVGAGPPTPPTPTSGVTTGGIYWKPIKDYEWPDLPGDVLSAVHAAVREISGEDEEPPTVAKVVASVQPQAFAMPVPRLDLEELAAKLREAAQLAIEQWEAQEKDDEEAILALLH